MVTLMGVEVVRVVARAVVVGAGVAVVVVVATVVVVAVVVAAGRLVGMVAVARDDDVAGSTATRRGWCGWHAQRGGGRHAGDRGGHGRPRR